MEQKDKINFIKSIHEEALNQQGCSCPCHTEGVVILHTMPCCNKTYEKFR